VVVWREARSTSTILVDIVCIEAADTGGPESVGITQIWAQSSGCEKRETVEDGKCRQNTRTRYWICKGKEAGNRTRCKRDLENALVYRKKET
jgi:hypothetical protein